MAVNRRTSRTGQSRLTRLIIGVSILAALVAIAPIFGAFLGIGKSSVTPRTAFASAPAGDYAVVSRNEGEVDVVSVVWAENAQSVTEIARVPHLDGFTSTGTVSPDGKRVALVTVDAGSPTRPGASLIFVNLETGELFRGAIAVEPMQNPVWHPDGTHVYVTRAVPEGVAVVKVSLDANEDTVGTYTDVLGVYPLGFAENALIQVVIDGRGSTVQRNGSDLVHLGPHITRDWQLSPAGDALAYIEVNTDAGLEYFARTASLGSVAGVAVQAFSADVNALGVAWNPDSGELTYGTEPATAQTGFAVESLTADGDATEDDGFDVPFAYATSGKALAVMHWSGPNFDTPGDAALHIVTDDGRSVIDGYTGFFGWSRR